MLTTLSHFFKQTNRNTLFLILSAAGVLMLVCVGYFLKGQSIDGILRTALMLLAFGIFYLNKQFSGDRLKSITQGALAVIVLYGLYSILQTVFINITSPKEWDFLCFYLDGKVGLNGLNFYAPDSYRTIVDQVTIPIEISKGFEQEILDVAFKYPPQTMLLFFGLGQFDYTTAQVIWASLNLFFLLLCTFWCRKLFLNQIPYYLGILFSAAILFNFPPTKASFHFEQDHFLSFFILLLIFRDFLKPKAGIWVALGTFVKPLLALMGLYYLLKGKWKPIGYGIATGIMVTGITIAFFGMDSILQFATRNPNLSVPNFIFTESVNQSLSSVLIRTFGFDFSQGTPLLNPLFLVIALILTVLTSFILIRSKPAHIQWGFALCISFMLLVYPSVSRLYDIYLLIPIWLILTEDHFPFNTIFQVGIVVVIALLTQVSPFAANIFSWVVLFFLSLYYQGILKVSIKKDIIPSTS